MLYYVPFQLFFFNARLHSHQARDSHGDCGKASDCHRPTGISCCVCANTHISQTVVVHGADFDVQDNNSPHTNQLLGMRRKMSDSSRFCSPLQIRLHNKHNLKLIQSKIAIRQGGCCTFVATCRCWGALHARLGCTRKGRLQISTHRMVHDGSHFFWLLQKFDKCCQLSSCPPTADWIIWDVSIFKRKSRRFSFWMWNTLRA